MAAKDITIRLTATGGDQAAAEVRKVEAASTGLGKALPGLADAHQMAADSAIVQGQGMQQLAASQARVSASAVNMRAGLQNVGYQIQDFAVQTQGGTSAIRAFSQQAPQLLSALGPWGVGLGTIVALGAPLAAQLIGQADAAAELGDAYAEATEKTLEMAAAQRTEQEIETASEATKQVLSEALREIISARFAYNESLRESIDLLSQEQAAENEIAAAKAETEIAAAEGDPVKQEQIRNRTRQEAQQRELQQMEQRRKALSELMDRRFQQQESVRVNGTGEAERLRQAAAQSGEAALTEEQRAETLAAQSADLAARGQNTKGPAGAAMRREAVDFQRRADEAKAAAQKLRAQQSDLTQAADTADQSTRAEVKRLDEEMGRLFDEIRKLEADSATKSAVFAERDKQGSLREDTVRKREADRLQKQRERDEKDAARKRTAAEARIGSDAVSMLPDNVRKEFRDAVERTARGLKDGDQGGEIAELLDLMNKLAAAVGHKDKGYQQQFNALKQAIANLEKQGKNNRKD